MIGPEPTAIRAPKQSTTVQPRPRIAGWRVTDLTAAAGGAVWLGLVAGTLGGVISVTAAALYVALAALVLVPLGVGLVDLPRDATAVTAAYRTVVFGQLPAALALVAALSLCWTMALALAFRYSALPGTASLVTIPEMIRWHGSGNALGFALPALLAFRLLED